MRITYDAYLLNPRIAAVGDTLHVVANGPTKIYYLRSNDGSDTWTEPICPVDTFYGSQMPDIAFSEGLLHVVWKAYFTGERCQILHISSSDGGRTWSEPHQLFENDSGFLKYPRLAISGDTLFASCVISSKLLVLRSFDKGETWADSVEVEAGSLWIDLPPYIVYSQGRLHLIYQIGDNDDSTTIEIAHRSSDDLGETWSDRVYISTPEHWEEFKDSQGPSAYADSLGNIAAFWFDYKYGSECGTSGDILGRVSRDNGETWAEETRLTHTQTGSFSTCLISDDKLYTIWMDYGVFDCSRPNLVYSISDDWGRSWEQPNVIFEPEQRNEYSPHLIENVMNGETILHCVFHSDPEGMAQDLFYFRSAPTTGIDNAVEPVDPFGIELTAYPNPFNSSTTMLFSNGEGGDVEIEIINLIGQRVKSFIIEGAKEGRIIWDATDALGNKVSSGIYFARAKTHNNYTAIKLMYMK
jgi:photosystem II stability/assembly factor-like uncharacterized protein